ncbi:hypothetical protein GO298_01212 [Ralstonia solanacearum]|nr:hypothetical protein [Ralstonia solanacearum]
MPRICTAWAMAMWVFGAWLTPEGAFPVVMLASFCGVSRFVKQYRVDHWYGLRGNPSFPVNATVQT